MVFFYRYTNKLTWSTNLLLETKIISLAELNLNKQSFVFLYNL